MRLPSGTITFLFTDIEGSTSLWERFPEQMQEAVARHDALLNQMISQAGGIVLKDRGEGDSFFAVFRKAAAAAAAACGLQRALCLEPWTTPSPVRVRVALHTGEAQLRAGDYYGATVNRCARLRAIAHGGQILLSKATHGAIGDELPQGARLHDWGKQRLRDLTEPEHVFQLLPPDVPPTLTPLKSLSVFPNLPFPLTRFIGREQELAKVKLLLEESRLVTLTGLGGCGKTRLSLQAARELTDRFSDGICFVELSSLNEPALLVQTVAGALGVRQAPERADDADGAAAPLLEQLCDFLQPKAVLLILDNCEHVRAACAGLVQALLQHCVHMRVLASSRQRLGVVGERTLSVPPLSLPRSDKLGGGGRALLKAVSASEAVQLFVERAAFHRPGFALTQANAHTVAQLCQQLEGIPLAIELAAARVSVLSVAQIGQRLHDRFKLLSGEAAPSPPHQRTLQAAMDWSYDLLTQEERLLLGRLSAFAGRFSLEAAESVCSDKGLIRSQVLDALAGLAEKSLVLVEGVADHGRYRLLQTVRQYASHKLQTEEVAPLHDRHRDWALQLAEAGEPQIQGPDQVQWLEALDHAHDDLRSALQWSLQHEHTEAALRMAGALWWFWLVRGYWVEGESWLQNALAQGAPTPRVARAKALNGLGVLQWRLGKYEEATQTLDHSLRLYQDAQDRQGMAYVLNNLGLVLHRQGDNARAVSSLEGSLALFRQLDDARGIAYALNVLGLVAHRQGNQAEAAALCEECLTIRRRLQDVRGIALVLRLLGNVMLHRGQHRRAAALHRESLSLFEGLRDKWGIANSLGNLAMVAHHQGHNARAQQLFRQSLTLHWELGEKSAVAACLEGMARVACAKGDMVRTAQLYGSAQALRQALQAPMPAAEQVGFERYIASAKSKLGKATFTAAQEQGRKRPLEQTISYALKRR